MRESGAGQVVDVLFLALMIAFGSSLLIAAGPVELDESTRGYATSLARSTLLSFQQAPIGELSYRPSLQVSWESEFSLRHKTPAQLILEDALLNPQVEVGGRMVSLEANQEFDESVHDFLRRALDRLVGGRFGYRLNARMTPTKLPSGTTLHFAVTVEDFDENSKQLCSESVSMILPAPKRWLEETGKNTVGAASNPIVTMTLELWSR